MARIIQNREVYQEVSLSLFREADVQSALASRATILFPGYIYAKFTGEIYDEEYGCKIPDFVLIETGYRRWYIGEVELTHHNLYNHVLPQVRTFRRGEYIDRHAELVCSHCDILDIDRLKMLFANTPPTVLVIVNRYNQVWQEAIHSESCLLTVFEIFRREQTGDFLFRINGDSVDDFESFVSYCVVDKSWRQALKILAPAAIPFKDSAQLDIEYNGIISKWLYRAIDTKAWLMPIHGADFPSEEKFELSFGKDNQLQLKPNQNAIRRRS